MKNLRMLMIKPCGRDEAQIVHTLTQSAFKHYLGLLDPPSGVVRESAYLVRHDLEGAAVGDPVGHRVHLALALAWCFLVSWPTTVVELAWVPLVVFSVIRAPNVWRTWGSFAVQPLVLAILAFAAWQGVSLLWSPDPRQGLREVRLGVRLQLSGNQAFYRHLGYKVVASHRHPAQRGVTWYDMVRTV